MPDKKKTAGQKKVHDMVAKRIKIEKSLQNGEIQHYENAIRLQVDVIKKDYYRLMTDCSKGYVLVKHWVGNQAAARGEMLRARFNKN